MLISVKNGSKHCSYSLTADAVRTISYVTNDNKDGVQAVIDIGCVPNLVGLLGNTDNTILSLSMQSIYNIIWLIEPETDHYLVNHSTY